MHQMLVLHARSLASPAAGNLRSHSALFGTRFRMLHLKRVGLSNKRWIG